MATEIDNRIVEMQFNNKQFEEGVKQTTSTLEKFKDTLKFDGAKKGFADIESAANDVKLNGISNSVDELSNRFSALGVVGMTVIQNLTNRLADMAINMAKSLSIDNFSEGWTKYEQQLSNFQTIYNNAKTDTGELISSLENGNEYVKSWMNELMWYTDETSYSFSDMVGNIGRFTSNGIGLETSVKSMMGIANAAGLAGAGVQDATHAMDGFSKAIGMGYMSRQNWRWIETAHMDTEKFKQVMIDAAVEEGNLVKVGEDLWQTMDGNEVATSNFLEALKDGWMDTKVINKGLATFGDATQKIYDYMQEHPEIDSTSEAIKLLGEELDETGIKAFKSSQEAKTFTDVINAVKDAVSTGWMKTFELIFGDYQESVEMWTALANNLWEVFAGPAETRNDILQFWHDFGGRTELLRGMANIGNVLMKVLSDVRETFADVFGLAYEEIEGDQMGLMNIAASLTEMCTGFADATEILAIAFGVVGDDVEEVTDEVDELTSKTGEVKELAYDINELAKQVITGMFGNGEARRKALEDQGYSYELIQNKVNELLGCSFRYETQTDDLTESIDRQAKKIQELNEYADKSSETFDELSTEMSDVPDLGSLLVDSIRGIADALEIIAEVGRGIISDVVMPIVSWGIPKLVTGILQLTGGLGRTISRYAEIIRASGAIGNFFSTIRANIENALSVADVLIDNIGTAFKMVRALPSVRSALGQVEGIFNSVLNGISNAIYYVMGAISSITIDGTGVVGWIVYVFNRIFTEVNKVITQVRPFIDEFLAGLGPSLVSIGDILLIIAGTIAYVISTIDFSFITNTLNFITEKLQKVRELIESFTVKNNIKGTFKTLSEGITEYFSSLFKADQTGKKITDATGKIQSSLGTFSGILSKVIEKVKGLATPIIDKLNPALKSMKKNLENVLAPAIKFVKTLKIDDILKYTKEIALVVGTVSAVSIFKKIGGVFEGLSSITTGIGGILGAFKDKIKAQVVTKYAIAIGILAASLWALSQVPSDKLITATACLGAIIGMSIALMGTVVLLNKLSGNLELFGDMGLFVGLGIVIGVLVAAIMELTKLSTTEYITGLGRVLIVLGITLAAMWLLGKINETGKFVGTKNSIGTAIAVFLFASAINKVVKALIEICNQGDLLQLQGSMLVLVECMGILAMVAFAAGHVSFGGGVGMFLIVEAMSRFVNTLIKMEGVNFKQLDNTLRQMGGLFFAMLAIAFTARIAGKGALGTAVTILALTFFLEKFAGIVQLLGGIPDGDLKKAVGVVNGITTILIGFVAVSTFVKINNMVAVAGILGSLTVCMYALAALVTIMSFIGNDKMVQMASIVETLLFIITMFVGVSAIAQKATGTILTVTLLVAALAGMMYLFSIIKKPDQVSELMDDLMAFLAELTGILALLSFLGSIKMVHGLSRIGIELGKGLASIGIGLGVGVAAIGAGVAAAAALMALGGGLLSMVVSSFASSLERISEVGKSFQDLDGAAVSRNLSALAQGFGEFGKQLGNYGVFSVYRADGMKGVTDALLTFKEIIPALSDSRFPTAMENMGTLAGKIKDFSEDISGIGVSNAKIDRLNSLSDTLTKLVNPLKEFQTITNVEKVKEVLGAIGESISSFSEALATDSVTKGFDDKGGKGIGYIFEQFEPMARGVNTLKSIPAEDIKKVLEAVGGALSSFAECIISEGFSTAYYNKDKAQGISALMSSLDELGTGVKKLADVGADQAVAILDALGPAFANFGAAISSSGLFDAMGAGSKADAIVELIENIALLGDQLQKFINTTGQFASTEQTLGGEGTGVSKLDAALTTISTAFNNFAEAIKSDSIQDAFGAQGKAGGIVTLIGSINSLADGIKYFIETTDPVKDSLEETTGIISSSFESMGTALGNAGWFAEGKGEGLAAAMDGVRSLARGILLIGEISPEKALENAGTITNVLDTVRTAVFSFNGTDGIEGGNFATVVSSIMDLLDKLAGFDWSPLYDIGPAISEAIYTGLNDSQGDITGKLSEILQLMLDYVNADARNFQIGANGLMQGMIDGMEEYSDTLQISLKGILDGVASAAEEKKERFATLGRALMEGVAEGISDNSSLVSTAVSSAIDSADKAGKSTAKVNSPSKLFAADIGDPISEGIAFGITRSAHLAGEAATKTIKTTLSTMSSALNNYNFSDEVDVGSFMNPSITPVLDMDSAKITQGALSGMFDGTYALDIAKAQLDLNSQVTQFDQLVDMTSQILGAIQNGSDVYLDGKIITGYVNRRLGQA